VAGDSKKLGVKNVGGVVEMGRFFAKEKGWGRMDEITKAESSGTLPCV